MIASDEAHYFVRNKSEPLPLKELADEEKREVRAYLVLRERESWVESYREDIAPFSKNLLDRDSYSYRGADSWLLDNENLISSYEDMFGKGSVNLINYETSFRDHGDTCVSLLDSMQLPPKSCSFHSSRRLNVPKVHKKLKQ